MGERPAARDVVVVDVGLRHTADLDVGRVGQRQDSVGVALGINHQTLPPVVDEIGAVAELRRLQGYDLDQSAAS